MRPWVSAMALLVGWSQPAVAQQTEMYAVELDLNDGWIQTGGVRDEIGVAKLSGRVELSRVKLYPEVIGSWTPRWLITIDVYDYQGVKIQHIKERGEGLPPYRLDRDVALGEGGYLTAQLVAVIGRDRVQSEKLVLPKGRALDSAAIEAKATVSLAGAAPIEMPIPSTRRIAFGLDSQKPMQVKVVAQENDGTTSEIVRVVGPQTIERPKSRLPEASVRLDPSGMRLWFGERSFALPHARPRIQSVSVRAERSTLSAEARFVDQQDVVAWKLTMLGPSGEVLDQREGSRPATSAVVSGPSDFAFDSGATLQFEAQDREGNRWIGHAIELPVWKKQPGGQYLAANQLDKLELALSRLSASAPNRGRLYLMTALEGGTRELRHRLWLELQRAWLHIAREGEGIIQDKRKEESGAPLRVVLRLTEPPRVAVPVMRLEPTIRPFGSSRAAPDNRYEAGRVLEVGHENGPRLVIALPAPPGTLSPEITPDKQESDDDERASLEKEPQRRRRGKYEKPKRSVRGGGTTIRDLLSN